MSKEMTTMAVRRGEYLVGLAELVGLQNPGGNVQQKVQFDVDATRTHIYTRTHARTRACTHTQRYDGDIEEATIPF